MAVLILVLMVLIATIVAGIPAATASAENVLLKLEFIRWFHILSVFMHDSMNRTIQIYFLLPF